MPYLLSLPLFIMVLLVLIGTVEPFDDGDLQ